MILSYAAVEANRFIALAAYRHVLRATRIAFHGDDEVLTSSRILARESFAKGSSLVVGSTAASKAIEHAEGVAQILRENVVQGKNIGGDLYKLNIHEHTQRLDNETAKQLKGTTKSFKEIKNAQF
ncbi:hypothetical protein M433DRAFT_25740 [Acidomyces richmondensis BFW]|nr:MAG: hypothetical protein FE78DRAFT_190216 [Acidomyces sp. 'richmondensis']KYG43979.1 hypothetical protein M433DRAFT_25740 [Acidomyces richmondensis BFW]